jgi:predicted lipoprotein with Yx(FWY)xxD motif
MKKTLTILALLPLLHGVATAQPIVREGVLADPDGRTLYIFDKDTPGKSNCSGGCLVAWPAFVAKDGAQATGDFTLLEANGVKQWAVKGKPLYYFAGDTKVGERNGENSGGVWHTVSGSAAKPAATKSTY